MKFSVYLYRLVFVMVGVFICDVLSLFVPHFLLFWCIGTAVFRDCGVSWVFLLIYFNVIYFSKTFCITSADFAISVINLNF